MLLVLKIFFLFLKQKHVVGTLKNCFNETVLFSTKTHVKLMDKKIIRIISLKVLLIWTCLDQ